MLNRFLSCLLILGLAPHLPSSAQSSFGLGEINPWGKNYLQRDEPSLPTSAWQNSDPEILANLLQPVRAHSLTPLQRALIRRLLLSPARALSTDEADKLLVLRAKWIFDLGEAEAASDLMGQLKAEDDSITPEEIEADLLMALGQEARVCGQLLASPKEGAFWARTRVVCAIMTGDSNMAGLTLEFAGMQGVSDPWLMDNVTYQANLAVGQDIDPPLARFDSGVNLALSLYLDLPTPINAVGVRRKDLAAILANRTTVSSDVRVRAAKVAFDANLINAREFIAAFEQRTMDIKDSIATVLGQADAPASNTNAFGVTATPKTDSLTKTPLLYPRDATEKALLAIKSDGLPTEKLTDIIQALQRQKGQFQSYRMTASLFDTYIRNASTKDMSGGQYIDLARVAFSVRDTNTVKRLLSAEAQDRQARLRKALQVNITNLSALPNRLETPSAVSGTTTTTPPTNVPPLSPQLKTLLEARAFENARLSALLPLLQAAGNVPDSLAITLIEAAKNEKQKAAAGRVLYLWQVHGLDVPTEAVSLIMRQATKPLDIREGGALLALSNAVQRNAMAEVVLRAQSLLGTRPGDLHPLTLMHLHTALEEVNSSDVANDLLLQASNFWKEVG